MNGAAPDAAQAPSWRFLLSHPAHFIALGFGSGLAPFAPGTFGTLVAIPIALVLWPAGDAASLATAALLGVGTWAAQRTGAALGTHDHGAIVIDEVAAFLAMLFFVGSEPLAIAFAFVLFRLFDIAKPPPIRWVDAHVGGGWGVMADDLAAAALALVVHALTVRLAAWP
jgi:phosphatidylglycerophosphatase A